jgi:hypothetical protein
MGVYAMVNVADRGASVISNITRTILDNFSATQSDKFVEPDKYHATVLYSRVGNPKDIVCVKRQYDAKVLDVVLWDTHDVCIVALLDCPKLVSRHNGLMKEHGLQWDYPDYKPHITLAYDIKPDPGLLKRLKAALVGKHLVLQDETIESLDEDHSDTGGTNGN